MTWRLMTWRLMTWQGLLKLQGVLTGPLGSLFRLDLPDSVDGVLEGLTDLDKQARPPHPSHNRKRTRAHPSPPPKYPPAHRRAQSWG